MIHIKDLVKIRQGEEWVGDPRGDWIGIVTSVSSSAVGQTITILWPQAGLEERWTADALEVLSET